MAKNEPLLMENTKIGTFRRYNAKVFKRNRKHYRLVHESELTREMLKSAGLSGNSLPKVAKDVVVEIAPDPIELTAVPSPDAVEIAQRPDIDSWSEEQLREYAQDNDIPTHPNAKKAGLNAAITRYFDDLAEQAAD